MFRTNFECNISGYIIVVYIIVIYKYIYKYICSIIYFDFWVQIILNSMELCSILALKTMYLIINLILIVLDLEKKINKNTN